MSTDTTQRYEAGAGLTAKTMVVRMCGLYHRGLYHVTQGFALTLGHTECSYTVPIISIVHTVHCIATILLNHTI